MDQGAVPTRGERIVRGLEQPFEGVWCALTAAYEFAGRIEPFRGHVRTTVPLEPTDACKGVRVDVTEATETSARTEGWVEMPFSLEGGFLSLETDTAGLFLLLPIES